MAEGLRVQPPAMLVEAILEKWGYPKLIVCDRFKLAELQDCVGTIPLEPRVSRWSEAGYDIRALRRLAKDGPLSMAPGARGLLAASLEVAMVKSDDQGNTRLTKRSTDSTARDDCAAALVLGAGAYLRAETAPKATMALVGEPF